MEEVLVREIRMGLDSIEESLAASAMSADSRPSTSTKTTKSIHVVNIYMDTGSKSVI
jgi:hypothetical protein